VGAIVTKPVVNEAGQVVSELYLLLQKRAADFGFAFNIPHFYLQSEINAEPLVKLRKEINDAAEAAGIGKITVNDFILKATAVAAKRVPLANAAFEGESIIQYANVQLACAVTPVIRTAQNNCPQSAGG
jgi:pyruvate dehydrogenase E2 component (dihydrolipoamide acetyltransferase)